MVVRSFDTGQLHNSGDVPDVVFERIVELGAGAPWVRLFFSGTELPRGCSVRTTSLLDGDAQTLDGRRLEEWGHSTAYFNGSAVKVELVAAPGAVGCSLALERAMTGGGMPNLAPKRICGADDDRVPADDPTTDPAIGRLLRFSPQCAASGDPGACGGCTGFIADCGANLNCHLSAGHCFLEGVEPNEAATVLQFEVPASDASCNLSHPPARKQFAVATGGILGANDGADSGRDWALFQVFANPDTGRLPFEEQGAALPLAGAVPAMGTVRVSGYGVDVNEDEPGGFNDACGLFLCILGFVNTGTFNQTLQTDSGPLTHSQGNFLGYELDTCGGNSGSPVLLEATGEVIGIHTFGGCDTDGFNGGTAIDNADLQAALAGLGGIVAVPGLRGLQVSFLALVVAATGILLVGRRRSRLALTETTKGGTAWRTH